MSVNMVKSISQAIATVAGKYGMATADFTAAVEREAKSGALGRDVTTVALMQQPHESEKDARTHWTVFAVKNNDSNQRTTRHIV
ncbi:hypothetical protein GE09DRAFT_1179771 [Coniochaeta sp. 2T2.1]|nr:hypothetical protein GE09DRAFT_1179771 [Coniochaeta sp. 2T2.1]